MVSHEPQSLLDVELCALHMCRSRYDDIEAGLEDVERAVRLAQVSNVLSNEDVKQLLHFEYRCKHRWRELYFQLNPTNNQIYMKVHLRRKDQTYTVTEILE